MMKHILTIIWNQRRSNVWIFGELLLVAAILWLMVDALLVDGYTYYSPLGYDTEDVYKVNLGKKGEMSFGYVPDSLRSTREGEDLLRLLSNLKQHPDVESVALAEAATPYLWLQMYTYLFRVEETDSLAKHPLSRLSVVALDFMDLFRMTTPDGHPLQPLIEEHSGNLVITEGLEKYFYKEGSAVGHKLKTDQESDEEYEVAAVSAPIRMSDYEKDIQFTYHILKTDEEIVDWIGNEGERQQCLLRMKEGFPPEQMDAFLQGMGERLRVNNLYVSSVTPLSELRESFLKTREDTQKKKLSLVAFMLINVFFGIIGTFWLRTQYRRGEIGLRMALGSTRSGLKRYLMAEGLFLLLLTVPFVLLFFVNMLYLDLPDTYRLPYTWWRFAATFLGSYLLMGGMICLGIWLPAHRMARMDPAESLHYE